MYDLFKIFETSFFFKSVDVLFIFSQNVQRGIYKGTLRYGRIITEVNQALVVYGVAKLSPSQATVTNP